MKEDQQRRPDPVRWIWYTFGGALGPRYREWVLHDVTCRARWVRQVARAVVQVAPLGALMILVLGFGWITCTALIGGLVMALIYSAAYFEQTAAHRLFKHGYPRGHGPAHPPRARPGEGSGSGAPLHADLSRHHHARRSHALVA
jgi:hypothetical protein